VRSLGGDGEDGRVREEDVPGGEPSRSEVKVGVGEVLRIDAESPEIGLLIGALGNMAADGGGERKVSGAERLGDGTAGGPTKAAGNGIQDSAAVHMLSGTAEG
jgi:hypothetical protein